MSAVSIRSDDTQVPASPSRASPDPQSQQRIISKLKRELSLAQSQIQTLSSSINSKQQDLDEVTSKYWKARESVEKLAVIMKKDVQVARDKDQQLNEKNEIIDRLQQENGNE